jgi:hypothetical protein
MTTSKFTLTRNPFGHLILCNAEGVTFDNVAPVRAFPIQAPDDGVAMISTDGKEVAWIDSLDDLSAEIRELVREELGSREFMPLILRIIEVTSFSTPCTWDVETDRGLTAFVLRGEEDIQRIGQDTLLVSDAHGIHFLIRDVAALDKGSKKILDRFL